MKKTTMLRDIFEQKAKNRGEITQRVMLGKADANGIGRRINALELEMTLKKRNGSYVFSSSARVWNAKHTDIIMGGQCVDEVAAMVTHPESKVIANFILDMWQKYHLNDMHAGTPRQEAIIAEGIVEGKLENSYANNYANVCAYLREREALVDEEYKTEKYPEGYKYGCGWLTQEIPEKDLGYIMEFLIYQRVPEEYLKEQEEKNAEAAEKQNEEAEEDDRELEDR